MPVLLAGKKKKAPKKKGLKLEPAQVIGYSFCLFRSGIACYVLPGNMGEANKEEEPDAGACAGRQTPGLPSVLVTG